MFPSLIKNDLARWKDLIFGLKKFILISGENEESVGNLNFLGLII